MAARTAATFFKVMSGTVGLPLLLHLHTFLSSVQELVLTSNGAFRLLSRASLLVLEHTGASVPSRRG